MTAKPFVELLCTTSVRKIAELFLAINLVFLFSSQSASKGVLYNTDVDKIEGLESASSTHEVIVLPYYPYKHELTRQADSLFQHYANKEALKQYKKANYIFLQNKNWEGVAYSGNMIAELYTNRLRDDQLAENQLVKIETFISDRFGGNHPLLSDTYLTYGSLFLSIGNYPESLEYLEKALNIKSDHYGLQSIQVAEANYRLGQLFQHGLDELDKSKEYYNRALLIFEEFLPVNHPDLIKAYLASGSNYRYLNDYQRSLIYLDKAIYSYSLDSISNLSGIAISLVIKANTYNDLYLFDKSMSLYQSALNIINKTYGPNSQLALYPYMGLSVGYLRKGDYFHALNYLNNGIETCEKLYSQDEPGDMYPYFLFNKGECYSLLFQKDSAEFYLSKALKIQSTFFRENKDLISLAYYSMASVNNNFHFYDSAIYYVQKALIALDPEFDSMDFTQNPDVKDLDHFSDYKDIYALKARTFVNKFNTQKTDIDLLKHALEMYKSIDHLSDNLKKSEYSQESILALTLYLHQIYGNAINSAFQLFYYTKDEKYFKDALGFFEKNKYMLLFQNRQLAKKTSALNIPFEFQFREDSLKMLSGKIKQRIDNDSLHASPNKLSEELYALDRALLELREEMEIRYPSLYKMDFEDLFVELTDLTKYAAGSNSLLLEYFTGDSIIYVMGIGPEDVTIHQIKRSDEMNDWISSFLSMLSQRQNNDLSQASYERYCNLTFQLYESLLKPVIDAHDVKGGGQIIIAPDGILAQIPFEALIRTLPQSAYPNYSTLDYLINSYNISYTYSFNLLMNDFNRESDRKSKLLAFSYSGIDALNNPEKRSDNEPELPGTSREVDAIRNIMKGGNQFLEDEQATETEFKGRSGDFEIIHLAVHGIADHESSINSRLVFRNQNDSLNDGNLYLYELYNVDLNHSKLAVLSACETGIGKEFKGEGVFSVARGFANAGCPAIIMSLWKVNDMVSADIMSRFYKSLTGGSRINEALRDAKIEYIKNAGAQNSHPANWAAFVPLGQMDAVYNRSINTYLAGMIIILVLIIPVMIYTIRKRRKSNV